MSSTLWHGRFEGGPSEALQALNDSLPFDQRMFREDIAGSRAHVRMLCDVGLFTEVERDGVLAALDTVEGEIESGSFVFAVNDEDIHTAVERRVTELEPAGAKMHTGRSRNDQVATDLRLWTRGALDEVIDLVGRLQRTLLVQAEAAGDAYLPGYTCADEADGNLDWDSTDQYDFAGDEITAFHLTSFMCDSSYGDYSRLFDLDLWVR